MASGKRASMREGPLAALFRKTEEDAKQAERRARRADRRSRRSRRARRRTRRCRTPSRADRGGRAASSRRRRTACARAFSSELPDNLLEPATPAGERTRRVRTPEPGSTTPSRAPTRPSARPRSARPSPPASRSSASSASAAAAPTPINRMVEAQVAGRRVPRDQHRPAVAAGVRRRHHAAHRREPHARARLGLQPGPRARRRDGGLRPHQGAAEGLGHDLRRRRRGRRHRHRRGARSSRGSPSSSAR